MNIVLIFHRRWRRGAAVTWRMIAVAALLLLAPRDVAAEVVYHGVCDASAAVALDANHLVTASDEDNVLRLYRRGGGSTPVQVYDATPFLNVDPRHPESDLEGAARLGDVFFWISSHTLTRSGKDRPGRGRLFATRFLRSGQGWRMEIVGRARADLLQFLTTDPGLNDLRLDTAATRSPKTKDATLFDLSKANHRSLGPRPSWTSRAWASATCCRGPRVTSSWQARPTAAATMNCGSGGEERLPRVGSGKSSPKTSTPKLWLLIQA